MGAAMESGGGGAGIGVVEKHCETENLSHIQRSRFIDLPPIPPLSKLGVWVVKQIRFDELYAATVSDRSYNQWFKSQFFAHINWSGQSFF